MDTHMHHRASSSTHDVLTCLPRCFGTVGDAPGRHWGDSGLGVWRFVACVLLLSACDVALDSNAKHEERVRFSGRVVGTDGQGIPDAIVQILWCRWPPGEFPVSIGIGSLTPRRQELHQFAVTATDAGGAFAMLLPAWFVETKPVAFLLASQKNHGNEIEDFRNLASSASTVIVLADEERIEGSITDEFGLPVAGARVGMLVGGVESHWTFSDELGRFSIGRIVQKKSRVCCVYASRSPSDIGVVAKVPDSGVPLRLILPRGSTKMVHVRDAANLPFRNERVIVTAASRAPLKGPFRFNAISTDANGLLVIDGLHEEDIHFSGTSSGLLDPSSVSVVVMKDLRQIPLEVIDDNTGIGLSNIIIADSPYSSRCVFLGSDCWRSGNDVTFKIGRHDLSFMTEGYEPWSGVVSIDRDTQNLKIRLNKKK